VWFLCCLRAGYKKFPSPLSLQMAGFVMQFNTHWALKMAGARVSQDDFLCSVCLDLLKDPVTTSCGHSYCKSCITGCWDQEDHMRVYSCPQCKQTFSPRPALARNTMLAEVVEKLKKTKLPADCYAGAGDVQCDVCTGRKYKAVKSCLVCLESYCQTHFERHEEFHSRKPHKVTDATGRLQEMICQKHEKILEIFCHTDQKCICVLCMMDEHKNHDTVSAAEQRTEKQSFQSLSSPPESTDVNKDLFSSFFSFDGLTESVHQLRDKLEDFCKEELKKISDRVTFTNIVPRTRKDFLQYSHQLTLDLNTVNKLLHLTENNRVITFTDTVQSYPDHPDRFDCYQQVLCRESVCGRCYWELEWSAGQNGFVFISVSYKSISEKVGYECVFGYNDQSWSLICYPSRYSFRHNNIQTALPVKSISSRIGVYVDHSAGTLSFYSVSDTMSLIHTVHTTFTQPLYPGFYVYNGSSVKLCCVSLYSSSKMAESRVSQDDFLCPLCLDLLKDPVAIPCGHSYCKSCITDCWDQEDQKRVYSCPQCKQTFSPRPALARNTMLAEVVEKLKKTKLPADCYAGAGDVQCDVCTGRKYKAVKSCLMCLNSYCQNHLEQHESWFKGKKHNLTDATGRLQEMICQKHEEILKVFCRTDQKCICVLCTMDEHKKHDTVSAATQRTEKQKQLKEMQKTFQQRIQQREKDVQQLRETVESHKRSAQTAVEDSERIFTELIRSIERSRSELIRLIRDREKAAVSRAEGRLERLEQEINDLRRRDAELEQLSHTQDHIQFLQSFLSLSAPPDSTDISVIPFSSCSPFDVLRESVHQLKDKLEDFCKEELKKISDRVTFTNIVPRTRKDFLQ
ncbi:hypothetical protein QQF64_004121, partial [Cirrhinus molitorella]